MTTSALMAVDVQSGFVNEYTCHLPSEIQSILNGYETVIATKFINTDTSGFRKILGWYDMGEEDQGSLEFALSLPENTHIIEKRGTYGFGNRDRLVSILSEANVDTVHICGMDTDQCVLQCAVDLFECGIRPLVLWEYCASSGGALYHDAALNIMRRFLGEDQIIYGKMMSIC